MKKKIVLIKVPDDCSWCKNCYYNDKKDKKECVESKCLEGRFIYKKIAEVKISDRTSYIYFLNPSFIDKYEKKIVEKLK